MKENPYVAPGLEETKSSEELGLAPKIYSTSIAEKMALEAGESVSEETLKLRKSIKGPSISYPKLILVPLSVK